MILLRPWKSYHKIYGNMFPFLLGIGNGGSNPTGFWCFAFTCWQVKHLEMNSATSLFIQSHQKFRLSSLYILVPLGCIVILDLCASSSMSCLKFLTLGTHSLFLYLNPPSKPMFHYSGSFANALANHFCKISSLFWASRMRSIKVGYTTRQPKRLPSLVEIGWMLNSKNCFQCLPFSNHQRGS